MGAKLKTTSGLNQRKGAGTEYGVIQTIPQGKTVEWEGYAFNKKGTEWRLVEYAGKLGFCSAKYLKEV